MKKNPDRKKIKKAKPALQHLRKDFRNMMGEERLNSFMTQVPIIYKPVHLFAEQIDRAFRYERVNALLLVYIHQDIFLDYDKIIDIYASKYPRRMLLINPLSENQTVETFNARRTYKA